MPTSETTEQNLEELGIAVERHSIDHIPASQRHGSVTSLFTIWFGANMHMTTIVTGALGTILGLPLPWAIHALTEANAQAIGLTDRGLLASGMKADVNVIDYERLRLHAPHAEHDLPAGGRRLIQNADGYDATIVSGIVTYRHGIHTGALPGRLVRNPARTNTSGRGKA